METSPHQLQNEIEVLKEKLDFAQEILDKAPCFLYINEIGRTGEEYSWRNVYMNKYGLECTGYTREEVVALGADYFKTIMHPDDYEVASLSISHLKDVSDDEVFGGPYKFLPKNKNYKWLIGMSRVFKRDPEGNPVAFLNTAVNLEDTIHLENQIIDLLKENRRLRNENKILKLTGREKDVLKLLVNGHCAKAVAKKLHISESTIITHRKNMLKKLDMHNTASLVSFAVENGLN